VRHPLSIMTITPPPPDGAELISATLERRVTHVRVEGSYNAFIGPTFEHITLLNGPSWTKTRQEVVDEMEGGWRYYVDNGLAPRAYLQVVSPMTLLGSRYVRTAPDCTAANNLLALPRF